MMLLCVRRDLFLAFWILDQPRLWKSKARVSDTKPN